MDFKQTYFEIFQLPADFQIDQDDLADRYRRLQRSVHPDKFADASERDRRLSMQWATQVNEAYATLKAPLPRAMYLMKLNGVDMRERENAQVDPMFLMEQIELREDLEAIGEADDAIERLDAFKEKVHAVSAELEQEFEACLAKEDQDVEAAEQAVLKMQFMNKLLAAAGHLEEKLLDY